MENYALFPEHEFVIHLCTFLSYNSHTDTRAFIPGKLYKLAKMFVLTNRLRYLIFLMIILRSAIQMTLTSMTILHIIFFMVVGLFFFFFSFFFLLFFSFAELLPSTWPPENSPHFFGHGIFCEPFTTPYTHDLEKARSGSSFPSLTPPPTSRAKRPRKSKLKPTKNSKISQISNEPTEVNLPSEQQETEEAHKLLEKAKAQINMAIDCIKKYPYVLI
jgi:hypothetical protein